MSDRPERARPAMRRWKGRRDAGMTIPEVTISVAITGIVVAVLSMATTVILRQMDNTEGRTNNARSEQNVDLWMPTDLSSAETVDTTAGAVPCGPSPACPSGADISGSNALQLSWTGSTVDGSGQAVPTTTTVSYRVVQVDGEFRLNRVSCYSVNGGSATCQTQVVLRDLDPPPPGTEWIPGVTSPTWIMTVSNALAADDTSGPSDPVTPVDPGLKNKNAQRVIVTINGGGDAAGAGGGTNQISLSAGGTNREQNLTTDDLVGAPTFTAARSRCGGNFGLIVDRSGSIGSTNMGVVRTGVKGFIDAFAGTPVKLQVVSFSATADTLGGGGSWTKYYDMLIESDVAELKGLVDGLSSNGGTNWEDGFFRMLRNSDGTVQAQLPNTILFFTDGVPTRSRLDASSGSAPAVPDPIDSSLPPSNGTDFSQVAWNRTERLIRDRGAINLVGVYVNSDVNADSQWTVPGAGFHWLYERNDTLSYEQAAHVYERASNITWQRSTDSDLRFQRRNSPTSWTSPSPTYVSWTTYSDSNVDNTESDGWRTRITGGISTSNSSFASVTEAQYWGSNTAAGSNDGFRTRLSTGATGWVAVTEAQYLASNTTSTESDGWRMTTVWNTISESAYSAGNTTGDESDGFRTVNGGGGWVEITQAEYDANNSAADEADGWRSTKVYSGPYTSYEPNSTMQIKNYATIGNIVVGNTSGVEGGFVEASPRGGPYTNAAAADLFVLPDYNNFASALSAVALDQCGGTVTIQTKVGSTAAQDPFTYENTTTHETVQTSAAYRSGTFDIALPGGGAQTVTISPQDFTSLVRYQPNGWSCKSAGVAYPFTVVPIPGHEPWAAIELTVNPNQAVSCVQQVTFT